MNLEEILPSRPATAVPRSGFGRASAWLLLASALLSASPGHAGPPATLSTVVTTTADSGTGSLRQAVLNANANAGADAITFDPTVFATAQTIVLVGAMLPTFTGDTTVTGPAAGVTVQDDTAEGIFTVGAGTTVSVTGLTLVASSTGSICISNNGTLTASNCVFAHPSGAFGAHGIDNYHIATVTGCTFIRSEAPLRNQPTGTLTVSDCTFSNCNGPMTNYGTATMTRCTMDSDATKYYSAVGNEGTLTLPNCSIKDQSSDWGLFYNGGALLFQNCTLFENAPVPSINEAPGTVTLKNTIYRRNPASPATTDGGGNLLLDRTGTDAPALAADLTTLGLDPNGLQDNGGPTKTIKLLGGPAIDGGLDANVPVGLTTDQRGSGFPRSVGTVDIGAYEAPANIAPTDIALSNAALAENNAANATVGTLTATDADTGDTHTFALVSGTGSTDNAAFTITGGALKINAAADFEAKSSYALRIRATDSGAGNLTFEKPFIITITDVNEAPVAGADSLDRPDNTKVAKVFKTRLLANDTGPEVADTLSIIAVGSALPSGSTVALVGNFVVYSAPATNSGNGSFTYTLSDGAGGHSVTGTVTVTQVTATGTSTGAPNPLRIVAGGGNFTTTYIGVPGDSYRVQFTTLTTPPHAWQEFSPPAVFTAPANGVFSHTDVQPANPVRLYRIVSNP